MNISFLWNNIIAFLNSIPGKISLGAIIAVIALVSIEIKNKKVKLMMEDVRFRDSKLFSSLIETPIVISKDGCIGFVNDLKSKYSVINLKSIINIRIMIDGKDIISKKRENVDNMLFKDIFTEIKFKLQEELKSISIIFRLSDNNNSIVNILIYKTSGRRGTSIITDKLMSEIKGLLEEFENVEEGIKSSE